MIKVNVNKRYITLAPIANLIGLAFKLEDPDALLDKGKEVTSIYWKYCNKYSRK
jgi:acyl-CoA dehydrogenase